MTMPLLRRSAVALSAALLGTALILTACGSDDEGDSTNSSADATSTVSPAAATRMVKADNGTIEVPANPQRVAVLGNAGLPYLDLGGKPVGITDISSAALADLPSDQKAAYTAATNLGSSGGEADLEKLATLKPDLIIIAVPDSDYAKLKDKLTSIAPTIHLGFQSDWKFRATAIAEASNKMDAFTRQKARYEELVAKIQQEYGNVLKSGKVVETYRTTATEPGQFYINGSLCAEAARDEGIVDFTPSALTSFEQIGGLAKYELILYSAAIDGKPSEPMASLMETNSWKALPAVQSDHAQGIYCPWGRSFGYMAQYLEGLQEALATLPKAQ